MSNVDVRIESIVNTMALENLIKVTTELYEASGEMLEALSNIRMLPSRQGGKTAFSRAVRRLQNAREMADKED